MDHPMPSPMPRPMTGDAQADGEISADESLPWERWVERLEDALGHDPDGVQDVDGFSLDSFTVMEDAGLTPEVAATRIDGSVFVTSAGDVYRLISAGQDPLTDRYRERYQVMLARGSFTNADTLPEDAVHLWRPAVNPEYFLTPSGEARA